MKRSVWGALIAASVLGLSVLGGCGQALSAPSVGGETHWLQHCGSGGESGFDCGPGLSCVCGVCTSACTDDASCSGAGDGAVCAERAATSYAADCELAAPPSLCVAGSDVLAAEPDRPECGERLFSTKPGCLSCSAVRKDLQILRDELEAQYSGSCSRDEDCVFAAAGTGCDEGCGAAVLRSNVAAYDRDLELIDRAYCREADKWRAQCGTHAADCSLTVPRCSPFSGACYAGQPPTPCSDRPRTGCEEDGVCILARGALYDARGQCFPAQAAEIRCASRSLVCPSEPTPVLDSVGLCYLLEGCIPEGFVAAPPEHPCNSVVGNTCTN